MDIMTKEWSGKSTRDYKDFKGLKKNLRDHMTNMERIEDFVMYVNERVIKDEL